MYKMVGVMPDTGCSSRDASSYGILQRKYDPVKFICRLGKVQAKGMFLIKNLKDLKDFAKQTFNRTCCLLSMSVLYVSTFQTIDQGRVLRACYPKSKVRLKKMKNQWKNVCRNASFSRKNSLALNQLSLFLPVSICYFRSSPRDLEPWDHYCKNTGM